jgi:uncharacterized membrane protein
VDGLFEFFFKYRPVVFEQGRLAFAAPRTAYVAAAIVAALAVLALVSYARTRGRSGPRDRVILGVLRVAALLIVLVCLFRPMIVLSAAVPQRNVLGILIDDSRSMRIADEAGKPRRSVVASALAGPDSAMYRALAERFILRFFRFAGDPQRAEAVGTLAYDGVRTNIGGALEGSLGELAGAPLSGLVVFSDGADNAGSALGESLLSVRARGVPVYTVGLGSERFAKDIEISRVDAPRSVLLGASLVVSVSVRQRGMRGATVPLVVEDGGRMIGSQMVTLGAEGEPIPVRVRVPTTEAGARTFRFRIAAQPGEAVVENNAQDLVVTVLDRKEKILYIEGEPRWELKFIRRAIEDDKNLQIATLQRTAESKFLRLSVDDSLDLVTGFPKTRQELFRYQGIILGSIEASYFTGDQLKMLAEFVSDRGGGLLALGGRQAFAEGGYAGTALADALPIDLSEKPDEGEPVAHPIAVGLTQPGAVHPATQIAGTEATSAKRWKELPPLTTVNRIGRAKPGATVLLDGGDPEGGPRQPVLLFQRYGRGKAIALAVQDTWLWQMDAAMSVEDMTHEYFWRQMLRWLVSDVPGRVVATIPNERVAPGEGVTVLSEVRDSNFVKLNSAEVSARVTAPSGTVRDVPLEWAVTRDGEYRATFTPAEPGIHQVVVRARVGRDTLVGDPTYVQSGQVDAEFFGAEMRPALLRRVANETGGRFYTAATMKDLPRDIVYTKSGNTVLEEMDLWDMPAIFLALIALIGAEWGYRRWKGLA